VVERNVADKTLRFECRPDEGVCRMELAEEARTAPSLEDDQVVELARQALALEEHFGGTQDIEWALHPDGGFVILQCRPLVQMERAGKDEDGNGADAPKSLLLSGGVTASPGAAAGAVHVVRKDMDALRFPDGAVLVAEQSLPRWAALLNRAAAVVTEQGGVAGHLANVAREFGVPGLFGLAGATEALENGQEVTVDADAAQVHQGRVEALLARRRKPRVLMQGSPVYEALRKASELIVPLHLLDPDSPEFRPANCRSLHDITRYCHEKSVQEMFRFGTQHRFPERSAKQLYCDVAMQFWVIDLEDGLERRPDHPVEDRFVFLDEIVSVPMLAVWRGMHAVPWGGPPPVDAKGFMSVLMESTANPQLDPSMPSDYAARNYFMISRTFCSLQSRFGFHFLTVETLVGERRQENYASFQFKGGAANLDRRVLRARLVAELLEAHGFLAEVKQDAVFARLEGRDREYMEKRLELVGYLLVHTRQLDMVMTSGGLEHHRERMRQDLKSLLHKDLGGAACPTR
jgi:pyruvate,water dikinase